ncbi:isoprenylcysteine carboxyl methyltransferase family protein [Streptomyces sp. SID14478]|uniref:isoprenylcysteine carboxyl methyltransferase family protein n=1 Tax=Streptomyces sp. SID14478 TaxID=2706073 RepID=UPI0013D929A1|nr:isoprenylcysteine carboxyl methyltransferase family protein [Streptomyces sp. SID14478]NEB77622.1 isoprenylcysteine carboxyl methyltransferase family protein [Streptomyces sp. SID14478]
MHADLWDVPVWLVLVVGAVAGERMLELVVSSRHARWARAHGGIEFGNRHYPVMVAIHTALLAGMLLEVALRDRPFVPAVGLSALAVVVLLQGLRWWCIRCLGPRWNTRVIVVPGLPLVRRGPYRWLRHPNYAVVVAEGIALPLVHGAWLTSLLFTLANSAVLAVRLRVENTALGIAT